MGIFSFKKLYLAQEKDVQIINGQRVYFVPKNIEILEELAFSKIQVDKVVVHNKVKYVENKAFAGNDYIKEVIFESGLITLGKCAFQNCKRLKRITLPDTLNRLNNCTFENCHSLEKIILPENLNCIGDFCFHNCKNLKNVKFNEKLKIIDSFAFEKCESLEDVIIPDSVTDIKPYAFSKCSNLKTIRLSNNLTIIESGLLEFCKSLEEIIIPENVKELGSSCLAFCSNLKKIQFPRNLKKIGSLSFQYCESLKEFKLINDKNISLDSSVVSTCKNLKKVYIEIKDKDKLVKLFDLDLSAYKHIFINLSDPANELTALSKKISKFITIPFYFAKTLIRNGQDEIFGNSNFKFYKRLEKLFLQDVDTYDERTFLLLCYNLGVFCPDKTIGNKVTNFIEEILVTNLISFDDLINIFDKMDTQGYKKDYTDFITKKDTFKKLLNLYNQGYDIFSEVYNNFEKMQETNVSRNVQHRKLAPTIEKCKNFISVDKFQYVTDENRAIADEVGKFSDRQADFELGVSILNRYKLLAEKYNYTNLEIENPFYNINALEKEIFSTNLNSLEDIGEIIKNNYSYEWLKKNDPKNLMLGYYCSCCAHIDGTGESIMIASILHPTTRNLIVKDENNKIIAKFTLYVNEKEEYGVINTASINTDAKRNENTKRKILVKLLEGINAYCVAYNKKNPRKKIKQVNIGDNLNGLITEFDEFNIKKSKILKGLDFRMFSEDYSYEGDWQKGQYCLFKLEEENEKLY